MEFKLFQYVLPLAMFVSCSDSSEVIPDVPEKLTFDKYEIACFEPSTKKDPVDTLFVSPMAAVSDFDVTIRRQVLSDGVFKGTYEYGPCSEVGVTVSNKDFSVELKEGSNMQTSSLSLTAPANMDYENAVLSSVSFNVGGNSLTMPVKQEKGELVIGDDYFVMYPGYKENEVLLDNKGEVIDFQCSLASSMYVNGVKMPEVWCDEECSFSYELEDNEWIKVVDSFVAPDNKGMFVLRIETVQDEDNGEHPANLYLRFEKDGKAFSKTVRLVSTEVYHISYN